MSASENEEARQQRQRALSDLARRREGAATPDHEGWPPLPRPGGLGHPPGRWRPRPWQVGILVVVVAAAVAASAVIAAHRGSPSISPTPRATAPLELLPRLSGFDCPQDMAWSSDGTRVALLGYELQCPVELMQGEYDSGPWLPPHDSPVDSVLSLSHGNRPLVGLALVYDSRTAKLLMRVQPDAAIQKLFPIPASVAQAYASINATPELEIHYTHVLWLPNTSTLAITFTTFVPSGPPPPGNGGVWPGTAVYGVVLADPSGSLRVLSDTTPYPRPWRAQEWDLTSGHMIEVPPALTSQSKLSSIAPALAYQWGANGAFAVAQQLPAAGTILPTSALLTPIGSPDGGMRFTIWQAGQMNRAQNGVSNTSLYSWTTDFVAVSPDGRYLLDAVSLDGLLQSGDGASQTTLSLPVRDAGLRQYLATLALRQVYGAAQVAWRPDGQVFAAQVIGASASVSPDLHAVLLFDCRTGTPLATLVPFGGGPAAGASSEPNLLTWSPDGSRLFLFDTALGTATIWAPDRP